MYTPVKDHWTIVVVGNWNVSIFSPTWLASNVFETSNIVVEYPVEPGLPLRITCDGISLIPFSHRLILNPSEISDASLQKMGDVACKLLQLLPHTPVAGTGINFAYLVEEPSDQLLAHFPVVDDNAYADQNMELVSRTFARRLKVEDRILNLTAEMGERSLNFGFNFDAKTLSAEDARSKISDKVLHFRAKAEEVLRGIYGLRRES